MSKKDFEDLLKEGLENFQIDPDDSAEEKSSITVKTRRIKNARLIHIDLIHPDPNQPRKKIHHESIQELAVSIKEHGILQPVVVEKDETEGSFYIIHGERRYRAAQFLKLSELPCIVQIPVDPSRKFAQQLVENIQREDLTPIDKARALLEYKEMLGYEGTWVDVEKAIGISEIMRKRFVALLKLPQEIQSEIVSKGKRTTKVSITEKHARALLMLNKLPEKQTELFRKMKDGGQLTGEQAIEIAKKLKGEKVKKIFQVTYKDMNDLIHTLRKKLQELESSYSCLE